MENINSFGTYYHNPSVEQRQSPQPSTPEPQRQEIERRYREELTEIEREFQEIRKLEYWERPIVLAKLADRHKIPKSHLKKSFDSWLSQQLKLEREQAKQGKGGEV